MRRWINIGIRMLAVAAMLAACTDEEVAVVKDGPIDLSLGFTLSPSASAGRQTTRQSEQTVTSANIGVLRIIPMRDNLIDGGFYSGESTVDKSNPTARFYHYTKCKMSLGANRCLVYAPAVNYTGSKKEVGSLVATIPSPLTSTSEIGFGLESIYTIQTDNEGKIVIPTEATALATALTQIANVTGWGTSTNAVVKNLYNNFTNHGYNLPGSAANVKKWMDALTSAIDQILANPPSSLGSDETTLLNNIKTQAASSKAAISDNTYPRGLNLPDGAAAVRWTETTSGNAFTVQLQTTTLDNINSVTRFAYPAALYFFVNSALRTSAAAVNYLTAYNDTEAPTWEAVLTKYFRAGNSVNFATKAIAVESPVQYAVAQLKLKVKADASTLQDAKSQSVTVGSESFPLKGVIVCGQRPVDYEFKQATNSDVDVKFVYDSQVTEGFHLSTAYQDATTTLLLQSYQGENVNIILEFENNSGADFRCIDGTIYRGTRFYMIGEVDLSAATGNSTTDNSACVFTKDYTTTISMNVKSLAKAYNVLPNLLTNNLEIGVETTPDWVGATPTIIRME